MIKISYYQTTQEQLPKTFCSLAQKCFSNNLNTVVITPDTNTSQELDRILWTYSRKHFVPHATNADLMPEKQPVYITNAVENPNNSTSIIFFNATKDIILSILSGATEFDLNNITRILFLCNDSTWQSEISDLITKSSIKDYNVESFEQDMKGSWRKI